MHHNQWETVTDSPDPATERAAIEAASHVGDKPGALLDDDPTPDPPIFHRDDGIARAARRACGMPAA